MPHGPSSFYLPVGCWGFSFIKLDIIRFNLHIAYVVLRYPCEVPNVTRLKPQTLLGPMAVILSTRHSLDSWPLQLPDPRWAGA